MGYNFTIGKQIAVRVKEQKEYPWPIKDPKYWNPGEDGSKRTITIFRSDVLTKSQDGTYMKHTGLGCFGIVIPDSDVEPCGEDQHLMLI